MENLDFVMVFWRILKPRFSFCEHMGNLRLGHMQKVVEVYDINLKENGQELINTILKLKPSSSKGAYVKTVSMASTMSPGISIDTRSVQN